MFQVVERSIGSLVNDIVGNVQEIIRSEVRLAKAEVTEELTKARRAVIWLVAGAVIATMAFGFLLLTAVYVLAHFFQPWVAALIVALGSGAIGGALAAVGASQMKRVSLRPPRTITSVQENLQWAKAQAK
ncbi:MAG TPA: phage holin family protein [Vicinamibacterales bacterium]